MELSEREAHCMARLLQGALFGENLFDGCAYCKFQCDKHADLRNSMYMQIRRRLTEETGVDLKFLPLDLSLAYLDFPYCKFLANANAEAREYFKIGDRQTCQ